MDQTVPSRRALIVDDEFLIAFDLESSMRELGFDVCTVASNERAAIELRKASRQMWWLWTFISAVLVQARPLGGSTFVTCLLFL
jgi:ActR/RegA family two-component response regulator